MSDRRRTLPAPELGGRMLLERWIQRGRMTQAEAARQIGICHIKLNQYLHGARIPSLETAIRIEDATGIGVRAWLSPVNRLTASAAHAQSNGKSVVIQ